MIRRFKSSSVHWERGAGGHGDRWFDSQKKKKKKPQVDSAQLALESLVSVQKLTGAKDNQLGKSEQDNEKNENPRATFLKSG